MIAVVQRVSQGSVSVEGKLLSEIAQGYVILLGVHQNDTSEDVSYLVKKITNLRVMSDDVGKMNFSILDTKGEILLVSQFTLCADFTFGRRPSFIKAMKPEGAEKLYLSMKEEFEKLGIPTKTGKFGAYMDVHFHNDGPVTLILDSQKIPD